MKKIILLLLIIGAIFELRAQENKIGFNTHDAFEVSGNSVAHYGMSRISGVGYQNVGISGYFGLNFYTEGKERIKVLRNGNVGIGVSNPNVKLKVDGDIAALNKIGFNTHDAFEVSGNSVAHYGISRISGTGYQSVGVSGYFGLNFYTEGKERIKVLRNGNVGIGTTAPGSWKLAVNGKIRAKEIKVETGWADFVFYDDYKLPTLQEVEKHIKQKGHLKDIPSAEEVQEKGILLGEMDSKLLQKIEELTLYTIQQEKKLKYQDSKIEKLEKNNEQLMALNKKLLELQSRLENLESEK